MFPLLYGIAYFQTKAVSNNCHLRTAFRCKLLHRQFLLAKPRDRVCRAYRGMAVPISRAFWRGKKMTIMMIMTLFWWKTLMSFALAKNVFFRENAIQPFALESCLLHKLLASKHPSASASKGIIFHVSVEVDQHGAHGANERWSLGSWRGSQTRLRWTIGPDQHLFRARLCP